MSDPSDRWMREKKTGTSRQSSVKERWPPPDKDNKSSASSSKRESSRTAEHNRHQKPPSGRSSSTSRSTTTTKSEQTSSSSSTGAPSGYSLRSSRTTDHKMESGSQRSSLSPSPDPQQPTAGSSASQISGESGAVKKSHTSSHSKIIPEAKQVMVVESPKHQSTFNFTSSTQGKGGHKERNGSSSGSIVTRKVAKGTITITSQKRTPSPEQPTIVTVEQSSDDAQLSPVPVASSSEPSRNTLPKLTLPSSKSEATPHSSHPSHHHNINHIPNSPTSPGPYNSGNMSSGSLGSSSLGDHSHVCGLPVTCSSGVKDQTNPNSLDGPCKMVGGGLKSMEVDPRTLKHRNAPEKNMKNLQREISSESTSSSSTDKLVTSEGSLPLNESARKIYSDIHNTTMQSPEDLAGHFKLSGQDREENWDDSLNVEIGRTGQGGGARVGYDGGTMMSVDGKSPNHHGDGESGDQEQDEDDDEKVKEKGASKLQLKPIHHGGAGIAATCSSLGDEVPRARMLCPGSSFDMDESGKPITQKRRHTHQVDSRGATFQERQSLFAKLQSDLRLKEAEIAALKVDSEQKQQTIQTLQKTIKQDHQTQARGLRTGDVDSYTDSAVQLTMQLTELEAKLLEKSKVIAQLEQEVKQVGGASQSDAKLKDLEVENTRLVEHIHQLEQLVPKSSQTGHRERVERALEQSNQSDSPPPTMGYNQQRHLQDQLSQIPKLQEKVESLKRQLKHAETFHGEAKKLEQQVIEQITASSLLEQDNKKLNEDMEMQSSRLASVEGLLDEMEQENEELKSQLKQSTSRRPESGSPTVIESESSGMNDSISEVVAGLTARVDELEDELQHKDDMMKRLKKRVAKLTVAMPSTDPEGSSNDPQQDATRGGNKTAPQLSIEGVVGGDTEVETFIQGSAPSSRERRHKKHHDEDAEQLKVKVAALTVDVNERDVKIDNLSRQLQSFERTAARLAQIERHSKKQSKVVAELKGQLEEQGKTTADTCTLAESQQENQELKAQQMSADTTIRRLTTKNAELKQQVEKLAKQAQDYATSKYQELEWKHKKLEGEVTELQKTLATLQEERTGLMEKADKMSEVKERKDHLEQVVVNQLAVIANTQQALQTAQDKATTLVKEKEGLENQLFRIMKEKEELLSEVEVHRVTAATFQEDFESERKDREKAHTQFANMETTFAQQAEALNKKLENAAREIDVSKVTLRETESRYQVQISSLRSQTDEMRKQIAELEDEVQSRTQQGKQYKKMIDSYKDELAVSKEQAGEHKKQIELFANEADNNKRTCEALRREIENLKSRERYLMGTQGGSVSQGSVSMADFQKEKTRKEELEKDCLKLEQMYDELSVKFAVLTSENDQFKKLLGHQQPPPSSSSSSAVPGAYNPNVQRGGLTTAAGGQERYANQQPTPVARTRPPMKSSSVDTQAILNSRGQFDHHQSHSRNPVPTNHQVYDTRSDDPTRQFQNYGGTHSPSNLPGTSAGGQPFSGNFSRNGRPHTAVMASLQGSSGQTPPSRQSRDDLHTTGGSSRLSPHYGAGGNVGVRGQGSHFHQANIDDPRGFVQSDGQIAGMHAAGNIAALGGVGGMPRTEHAQFYQNLPGQGHASSPSHSHRYTSPSHYQNPVKPDIHVMGLGSDMGRYSEDTVEKDSPPGSLGIREGMLSPGGSSGPSSLNPQMLDSYQSQPHLQSQPARRTSYDQPMGRGGQHTFGNVGGGGGLHGSNREAHISSHDQQRMLQLNQQRQLQQRLQQQHHFQQYPGVARMQAGGGVRAAQGGNVIRGSSSPSLLPSTGHAPQAQPHGVDMYRQQPMQQPQHFNTADLSLRMKQHQQQQQQQQQQALRYASSSTARTSSTPYTSHGQSSQPVPKRPTQESSALSETSQSQLPPALRNQSQNVYSPPRGQTTPATRPSNIGRGGNASRFTEESSSSNLDDSRNSSYSASNNLESGIDSDIRRAATIVKKQVDGRESLDPGNVSPAGAPLDPNLICPTCKTQFRIGEIQKYRKHAATCIKE